MDSGKRERYERYKWRQRKNTGRIVSGLFGVFILALLLISIILPDREFSAEENRLLAGKPKISKEDLLSRDYMENMESYTADQFAFRDLWVSLKVRFDMLLGKREFNGVYLGKDKYLIQSLDDPNEESVAANLEVINAFAKENDGLDVSILLVPNAAYVMEDYLPAGAPARDQSADLKWIRDQLSEDVACIDIFRTMRQHADEGLYYRTDHHWTSRGASIGFAAAAADLGIEDPVTDYDVYKVTDSFSGTLASTSGYHGAEDTIEIYAPKNMETQYLVSDSDNEERRATLYDKSALEEKDKYQVFLGGNHATVDITTANKVKRRLLIFKDSYANCFVPFLLPYYNEIVMVDPRYYYDNVQTLVNGKGITDVLFLYNMDTFLTDNSIADVLAE